MNIHNIPNTLTHRTKSDPNRWSRILKGTIKENEKNLTFKQHYGEFIWSLMDPNCCEGHGGCKISSRMDTNYTLYRPIEPSGYTYRGTRSVFRNVIVVTNNCNVDDLNNVDSLWKEHYETAQFIDALMNIDISAFLKNFFIVSLHVHKKSEKKVLLSDTLINKKKIK